MKKQSGVLENMLYFMTKFSLYMLNRSDYLQEKMPFINEGQQFTLFKARKHFKCNHTTTSHVFQLNVKTSKTKSFKYTPYKRPKRSLC